MSDMVILCSYDYDMIHIQDFPPCIASKGFESNKIYLLNYSEC